MSKLTDVIVWNHRLSIVAGEEAMRLGHPEIDVDHLLLAMLLSDGPAGQHLREAGLTLAETRRAVEAEHAARVEDLGITAPEVAPLPLRDPTGRGLEWSSRALTVLRRDTVYATDVALLRALLVEPSGLVAAVVSRLPVTEADLLALPADEQGSDPAPAVESPWRALSQSGFVPAPVPQVWAMLDDPSRRPEWDTMVGTVEDLGPDTWRVTPAREGVRASGDEEGETVTELRLLQRQEGRLLEWEGTWGSSERGGRARGRRTGGRQRLRVELEPITGGTRTHLTLAVPHRGGWRGAVQRAVGPMHRFLLRQVLTTYTTGISRALR